MQKIKVDVPKLMKPFMLIPQQAELELDKSMGRNIHPAETITKRPKTHVRKQHEMHLRDHVELDRPISLVQQIYEASKKPDRVVFKPKKKLEGPGKEVSYIDAKPHPNPEHRHSKTPGNLVNDDMKVGNNPLLIEQLLIEDRHELQKILIKLSNLEHSRKRHQERQILLKQATDLSSRILKYEKKMDLLAQANRPVRKTSSDT